MDICRDVIRKMSVDKVRGLLAARGSVFVEEIGDKVVVKHIYLAKEKLESLEFSPAEQFEEILPNVWYHERTMPKVKNFCYWLYKNSKQYPDEENLRTSASRLFCQTNTAKMCCPFTTKLTPNMLAKPTFIPCQK